MGFDAEIDNSERSSVAENLKDDIQCAICLFILEEPVRLDCCDNHFCKKCADKCQNCPLCRHENFTAKTSRFMLTVLSQYKLFCPAAECNESVPYENFVKHKNTCPALNKRSCPHCKKLYWKNDFKHHLSCIEELNNKSLASQKKVKALESKIKSLTQSRNDLSQNNKDLKALNQEHEDTIDWLERLQDDDNIEIQNLKETISVLNEKIAAAASDRKNIQNERTKVKNLEKRLYSQNMQLQAALRDKDCLKSLNSTYDRTLRDMAVELEKIKNSKFYRNLSIISICFLIMYYFRCSSLQNELDVAKQIISNLEAKLGLQPKNSGFFSGLFG